MNQQKIKNCNTIIISILCIIGYIAFQMLTSMSPRLGLMAYNGVFMACQFGLCLILARLYPKNGILLSIFLMGFSLLFILREIFIAHRMSPLPGLFNTTIFIITLITLYKQFQAREKEAATDFLTGLLNHRGLHKKLLSIERTNKAFHIIHINLDNFKILTDNWGHSYGDRILILATEKLKSVVQKDGLIAKMDSEDFIILLDSHHDPIETGNLILEALREKLVVTLNDSEIECYLTVYAGIASYPQDGDTFETVLKHAGIAMYEASQKKMPESCYFNSDMEDYINHQLELEKLIIHGLEEDYFYLVYQPQYRMDGTTLRGFETLLRMKTPDGKQISPADFIPVAEKGELILSIDDYVLRRAMTEFRDILSQSAHALILCINVSAQNIGNAEFPIKLKQMLEETQFPPHHLEIEITEYCLVASIDTTIENIKKLRDMGVKIALDDFGTGYTSLSYLSKMPVNLLKLDKTLIDDIELDSKKLDFIHAIISMGHLMDCEVLSEGVKNEEQLDLLSQHGCDFIQGYICGKPIELEAAKKLFC